MTLGIEWAASVRREADRLDRRVRRRVVEALDRYAETGHGDVTRENISPVWIAIVVSCGYCSITSSDVIP